MTTAAPEKTLRASARYLACRGVLSGVFLLGLSIGVLHAAEPSFTLRVQGDRLTVRLNRAPLGRVLAELARQARLQVRLPPSLRADPLSDAFDLPLGQGVSRLLLGYSFAILPGRPSTAAQEGALTQLWVLPKAVKGSAEHLAAQEQAGWSRPEFLDEEDPARRLAALDALAQRRDADALDALSQAMVDTDEAVRAKAQALFDHALLEVETSSAPAPRARK